MGEVEKRGTCDACATKLSKYEREGDEMSKVVMDFKRLVDSWEPAEEVVRRLREGVDGGCVEKGKKISKGE